MGIVFLMERRTSGNISEGLINGSVFFRKVFIKADENSDWSGTCSIAPEVITWRLVNVYALRKYSLSICGGEERDAINKSPEKQESETKNT